MTQTGTTDDAATRQTFDAHAQRKAAQICREQMPRLALASHMLSKNQRLNVHILIALWVQLDSVLDSCDGGECATCTTDTCDGASTRRTTCTNILEFLYSGQMTGNPVLDAFPPLAKERNIPIDAWQRLATARADLLEQKRIATWRSLLSYLHSAAAGIVDIASTSLELKLSPQPREQIEAFITGLLLLPLVRQIGQRWESGKLLLPLDDLVKAGLTQSRLAELVEQNFEKDDPAMRQLLSLEADRILNLLRGGWRGIVTIEDPGVVRALAILRALAEEDLQRMMQQNQNMLGTTPKRSLLSRLRIMRRAQALATGSAD